MKSKKLNKRQWNYAEQWVGNFNKQAQQTYKAKKNKYRSKLVTWGQCCTRCQGQLAKFLFS